MGAGAGSQKLLGTGIAILNLVGIWGLAADVAEAAKDLLGIVIWSKNELRTGTMGTIPHHDPHLWLQKLIANNLHF